MRMNLNLSGAIAAALVLCAGGAAVAAEDPPIATASPAPVSTAPTGALRDPTADQIDAWLKADGSSVQRLDPNEAPPLDVGPRRIHGEVGATYSNRGYSGYGFAAVPLGEASELDVAVAGGHVRLPGGRTANPKSLAVGLYLDGGDVGRWATGSKCGVPRWGVALPGDPQVKEDGSCIKKAAAKSEGQSAEPRRRAEGDAFDPGYGSHRGYSGGGQGGGFPTP